MDEIERLNYPDGGRLGSADLLLEQRYHLGMRRRLNRGLFTAGVVSGLEVTKVDASHVHVATGVAIDPLGREMVVVYPGLDMAVPNQPPTRNIGGYFLALRYSEEPIAADAGPCPTSGAPHTARIREEPELMWTDTYPAHDQCVECNHRPSSDCAVVLALVTMTNCEIDGLELGVREYAHPKHVSRVLSVALEGEKDIDKDNSKDLHFQVRGGTPNSVVLYLWGGKFSSLYYTELGEHIHDLVNRTVSTETTSLAAHVHDLGQHTHALPSATGKTTSAESHYHGIWINGGQDGHYIFRGDGGHHIAVPPAAITHAIDPTNDRTFFDYYNQTDDVTWISDERTAMPDEDSPHVHDVAVSFSAASSPPAATAVTGGPQSNQATETHSHTFDADVSSTPAVGMTAAARPGPRYEFLDDLSVELVDVSGATDLTGEIIKRVPTSWGGMLGNSQSDHELNTDGTPGLDLIEIANAVGKPIDVGPHTLRFSVANGGGKILYNLYVD